MGGLGNQMFQYAAGWRLAKDLSTDLTLNLSWYRKQKNWDTVRKFELDVFKINNREIKRWEGIYLKLLGRQFREKGLTYDPKFQSVLNNTELSGYFPSEKYFIEYEDEIRELFTFRKKISEGSGQIFKEIREYQAVSLHVRRGDYADSPKTLAFHGLLPETYYQKAMDYIDQRVKQPKYYGFSDDVKWVKENWKLVNNVKWVELKEAQDWEQMYLMSQCKHNIIANSSFSWWSAWLNQNPEKIVIAPKKWFVDETKITSDLIPAGWVKI